MRGGIGIEGTGAGCWILILDADKRTSQFHESCHPEPKLKTHTAIM